MWQRWWQIRKHLRRRWFYILCISRFRMRLFWLQSIELIELNTFPHDGHTYRACCWSSNFLTIFLMAPPYLVPYFPTIPTFLVLLAIVDKNNTNNNWLIIIFLNFIDLLSYCIFSEIKWFLDKILQYLNINLIKNKLEANKLIMTNFLYSAQFEKH